MTTPQDVIKMVKENDVKFVDFRFTDTRGKEQHVGVPIRSRIVAMSFCEPRS